MLIMRRYAGETILIGDEIEVHIAQISRSRVKIGITAPKHVRVIAKEVKDVGDENRMAAEVDPSKDLLALLAATKSLKVPPSSPMRKLSATNRPPAETDGRNPR